MCCNNKSLLKAAKHIAFIIVLIIYARPSYSQEQRLNDNNSIGWFAYTGTIKIKPKIFIHTEYQWRRVDGIKNWQQSLLRTGVNFAVRKDISLIAGYAFAETFPYGDFPNANAFPEHRIFEQVVLNNPLGKVALSHRFTLEQRFMGKLLNQNTQKDFDWIYLNRMRYRVRAEAPITKKVTDKNLWSFVFMDEVFIGWGKNMGVNVFDQNRLAVLLGYKVNPNFKIEAGFLNQILQQGKRINEKPVFQYNNGFIISTHLTFNAL